MSIWIESKDSSIAPIAQTLVRPREGIRASHELLSLMHREKRALPFEIISERAQNSDEDGLGRITQAIVDGRQLGIDGTVLGRLAEWIDTYQADLRR